MQIFNAHNFILCLAALVIIGCSPAEKTVTGQVFIVTNDEKNIKMGLVEVCLVSQKEIENHLSSIQEKWSEKIGALRVQVMTAQTNFDLAQIELKTYESTNTLAISYQNDLKIIEECEKELTSAALTLKIVREQADNQYSENPKKSGFEDSRGIIEKSAEQLRFFDDSMAILSKLGPRIDDAKEKRSKAIERKVQYEKLFGAKDSPLRLAVEKTSAVLDEEKIKLAGVSPNDSLLGKDWERTIDPSGVLRLANTALMFKSFSSDASIKTLSDGDGKFLIKHRARGRLAVYARATRKVGENSESYFWFFWLPDNRKETHILLSNHNQATSENSANVLNALVLK